MGRWRGRHLYLRLNLSFTLFGNIGISRHGSCAGMALLVAGLIVLGGAQPAFAQTAAPTTNAVPSGPRPAPIDRNGMLILLRSTLIAVQQANQSGNYGVLYGISAPGFQ